MEGYKQSWKNSINQITCSLLAMSLHLQIGICITFATILLPPEMLVETDDLANSTESEPRRFINNQTGDELSFTKDEASWMASLLLLTATIASGVSGMLMDCIGRKYTCILAGAFYFVGWLLTISVKTDIITLYTARALSGIAEGLCPAGMIYATEATHASIRTSMMASGSVFVCFGILLTSVLGYMMTWRGVAIFAAVAAAVNTLAIFFVPETPQWLSMNTKNEEKRNSNVSRSLRLLYTDSKLFQEELERYKLNEQSEGNSERIPLTGDVSVSNSEDPSQSEKRGKLWKAVILLCVLFIFQQVTGGFVVIFYALQIFQATGSMSLDGMVCVVALGVIRFLMAIVAAVQYFGRRTLLLGSCLGSAVSIISASLWVHLLGPSLCPVILLLLYVAFSSYGIMSVPWTLVGELLPDKHRGKVSGYIMCYVDILMFIVVKISILVLDVIGIANMFLIFGVLLAAMFVFVYFVIPETMGKSLDEIQEAL